MSLNQGTRANRHEVVPASGEAGWTCFINATQQRMPTGPRGPGGTQERMNRANQSRIA